MLGHPTNPFPQLPPFHPRNSTNYQPTLWTYDFIQSLNNGFTDEKYKARERKVRDDVRRMIVNENTERLAKLELIDDIQRLGFGYHFDKEIKDALHSYVSLEETLRHTKQCKSLHEAALSFRLLRDHGYHVSQALYTTVNDISYETLRENGHYILPYLTKAWADMFKAFLHEPRWSHEKKIPSFDVYFKNAWMSVSGVVFLIHSYFFLNHNYSEESHQSLDPNHDLLRCPSVIFRLCNDLAASKAELEKGEAASSIGCYKHQSGDTEENSHKYIRGLVDETWKYLNKAREMEFKFSKAFAETSMNLVRISHCTYQYADGHGAPDSTSKNRVRLLIVEPIKLPRS